MSHLGSKAAKAKLKKIGGSLYERWSVWFNSIIHVESYQCRIFTLLKFLTKFFVSEAYGTAWLSSVRVVKCNIKLLNERNLLSKFFKTLYLKERYITDRCG